MDRDNCGKNFASEELKGIKTETGMVFVCEGCRDDYEKHLKEVLTDDDL
jgi:hypothetical protein